MVVDLGYMAKRKGVSSRANLLISVKVLVGNVVTTDHHARVVTLGCMAKRKGVSS